MGCPNMCSFCDQRAISGETRTPLPSDIAKVCHESLERGVDGENSEIAFFGGSFTAIPMETMLSYLEAVRPYVGKNGFSGIRISTRPDAVSEEILVVLKEYGVTAIELGAQSMSDRVLCLNRRGHTAADVGEASQRIKAHGFSLGLQMMYGLYGSCATDEEETLSACIKLMPETMRIYPTVVLEGTYLGELYKRGEYALPSWEEMLEFAGKAICRLRHENIKLIRLGLHAEKSMEERILAGFYHPALGELAEAGLYLKAEMDFAKRYVPSKGSTLIIEVSKGSAGKATGHKGASRAALKDMGYCVKIIETDTLSQGQLKMVMSSPENIIIGEEVYDVFKITGTSGL